MYLSGQCVFKSSMIRWPSHLTPSLKAIACGLRVERGRIHGAALQQVGHKPAAGLAARDPLQIVDLNPASGFGAPILLRVERIEGVHRVVRVHVGYDTSAAGRHAHPAFEAIKTRLEGRVWQSRARRGWKFRRLTLTKSDATSDGPVRRRSILNARACR